MVELKVLTLIVMDPGNPSFLVMEPLEPPVSEGKSRVVPICVGPHEAMTLGMALEGARFSRPMTHDLMLDAFTNLDAHVDHVYIYAVKNGTFFAQLVLSQYDRLIQIEARPSDAIALAIREQAPIYIEDKVLECASFPYLFKEPYDEERIVSEFKTFLEGVSPEDFE